MSSRYQRWKLERVGGRTFVDRLRQKALGGTANRDGHDFEQGYTLHAIVREVLLVLVEARAHRPFDAYGFEQQPDAFVDDLRLERIAGELFVQVKKGDIDWFEVVRDFKIQRRMDRSHEHGCVYRLVNGAARSASALRKTLAAHSLTSIEAEVFHFGGTFEEYHHGNEEIRLTLHALTGSQEEHVHEVAYKALYWALCQSRGFTTFSNFVKRAARHTYDYISAIETIDTHKDVEDLMRGVLEEPEQVRIVGRFIWIDGDGLLQSYLVPTDKHAYSAFMDWLKSIGSATIDELTQAMRECQWPVIERPLTI